MQMRLGRKYQDLVHGVTCACHTPAFARINSRLSAAMSRRSVLRGIGATLAASSLNPAAAVAQAPARPILLTNIRIFDGRSPDLVEGSNVLVSGNLIEAIVPAGEDAGDVDAVDCGGRVLMPGMIDAHWHSLLAAIPQAVAMTADVPYIHLVAAQEAERTLMRGFTTVRDMGGPSFSLKRAIDEGKLPGPRIFPSGAMISQTSGHGDFRMRYEVPRSASNDLSHAEVAGITAIADGVSEVLRRVREQLLLGASQIKIMTGGGVTSIYDPIHVNQFTPEEIQAAVNAASDWGTYVCSHVYTSAGIQRSLQNGVRCIEHGQLADEETAKMIAAEDAWWSLQPFLVDEDANPQSDPIQKQQQAEISEGTARAYELGKKHNIKMAWGTDILFSPQGTASQGRQLAKLSRWFENVDVLRMATGRNGELLAMAGDRNPYQAKLGVIEPGALADILVIDGNPLETISLIADPETNMKLIMKDGKIHKNAISG